MKERISLDDCREMSDHNLFSGIEYFEDGCLCILSGELPVKTGVSMPELYYHYYNGCVCSRHPEDELE